MKKVNLGWRWKNPKQRNNKINTQIRLEIGVGLAATDN
jgi:hypothetical protein